MDEVIADPIKKFIEMFHNEYGTPLDFKVETGKELHECLPEASFEKVYEYLNQKGFFRDLEVIEGSQDAIRKLQTKYDVYIVSAASEFRNSFTDKYDWLAEHFPFISWENIIFCGKKIVDVDIMIDDRIKNFVGFDGRPLLFSSPHNLLLTQYERVDNWQQVLDKLM
ncbi:MAG: 5'(3')-deoxyribonucleotidase [Sphingobacteriaceae bacterium]|nr:5'(3')-deoxyribonucleotidase [Sphingobacteriaceae bacterium]